VALESLDENQQIILVSQVDPNLVSARRCRSIPAARELFAARRLPAPTPAAAPPASPSAATSEKPHDEEQQYRTDGSVDDCTDHPSTKMDTQLRQQPASDKGAQNPDNDVPNDPKAGAANDLTCQPACDEADEQDDQ
jgi:hypothetical protein